MNFVKNPYKMCEKLYNLVHDLTGQLKDMISQKVYDPRGAVRVSVVHLDSLFTVKIYKALDITDMSV